MQLKLKFLSTWNKIFWVSFMVNHKPKFLLHIQQRKKRNQILLLQKDSNSKRPQEKQSTKQVEISCHKSPYLSIIIQDISRLHFPIKKSRVVVGSHSTTRSPWVTVARPVGKSKAWDYPSHRARRDGAYFLLPDLYLCIKRLLSRIVYLVTSDASQSARPNCFDMIGGCIGI